ncbi:MAG: hypothetical protein QM813_21450 [Verrucomicrobiota bacterium]
MTATVIIRDGYIEAVRQIFPVPAGTRGFGQQGPDNLRGLHPVSPLGQTNQVISDNSYEQLHFIYFRWC